MIKSFVLFCIKLVRFYWHQPNIKRSLENLNISNAFDVGAHKGQTVNYLLDLKNIKKIYSFEPQDIPFKYLKKKYQNNKKVILNKMALSNIRKKKIFYINEFSETSTFSKINKNSTWLKIKNKILDKKDSILDTVVIITSTNWLNVILGSQPSFSFAFDASPSKLSTSVGLKYLSETFIILLPVILSTPSSSIPSPFHSILRPKNGAAISTNSLTECCSPVAIT